MKIRNALIRLEHNDRYPLYIPALLSSNQNPLHLVLVIREAPLTKVDKEEVILKQQRQAEDVQRELKEFDDYIIQSTKLSFAGKSPLVDGASAQSIRPVYQTRLDILQGIAVFTPLTTLFASGYFLGGHDALSNPYFWVINAVVYAGSQFVFPNLNSYVSKIDLELNKKTGFVTKGIQKRMNGDIFEKYQRSQIVDSLERKIREKFSQLKTVNNKPVTIAVVATPDIADLLTLKMSQSFTPVVLSFKTAK